MKNLYPILALSFAGVLAGCTTPEWDREYASCMTVALDKYPPNIVQREVQRTRTVEVPDGTMTCTGGKSQDGTEVFNCVQNTKEEQVPYTAIEDVDLNEDIRKQAARNCTQNKCVRLYGNTDCKPAQ